jgi:Holliday junction DNA helicase RuvB
LVDIPPPSTASARSTDPGSFDDDERRGDDTIRPDRLEEFIGQQQVTDNLRVYIEAARRRREALDHILLSGMPGLGKTTLASLVAHEMGTGFRATSGPVLEKAKDLVGLLTELEAGDVLFIDEVHRLSRVVEEYLYTAMEDFQIDILIDSGPNARSVRIDLPRFTLVAATTREGNLTAPFRARFGIQEKLEPYGVEDMRSILGRSARIFGIATSDASATSRSPRGSAALTVGPRRTRSLASGSTPSDWTPSTAASSRWWGRTRESRSA